MNFVLNFLMEQVIGIMGVLFGFFINVITNIFSLNGAETLNLFYHTFPGTEDVMDWSKWCGLLLILIIFFVQLIKIMAGPVTKAERPLSLVVRTVVFGAAISLSKTLCEFIFTVATGPFKAMQDVTSISIVDQIGAAIKDMGTAAGEDVAKDVNGVSDFVAGAIAPIITFFLIISLFGAFFKLLLEVVERYLILGVLTVFSPLAIATGCSAATSNIFGSWVRAMISQCLLMIFSTFFLSVLYNGMIQIAVDGQAKLFADIANPIGTIVDFVTHEEINDSTMLCVRVMMLVAWCRLGTTMDRHLQTLGLTTLQAGDGLAMDLRNGASMAKGLAKGAGSFAGGLAGGLAALKAAGGGGNNNTTNNNSSQTTPGGGQNGNKAPGVGSSNLPGGPAGKGTSAGSLSNNCQPISNALKDAGISAGNGTTDENGVTTFPLTGPNGEDLGNISLSKDVPENAEDGNFVAVNDGAGNTLYAQASDDGVQNVLNNSDDDNISVGVVNENGVGDKPIDDSDKETNAALAGAETFDMVPMDEDGNAVDADVPDSIPEDQVSFAADGTPYFDADGQNVPLVNNGDGTYTPANYGVARNQDGSGEYAMSTSGELVQIPNLNNIPASQVKTDANGNSYCSINGQNIPVKKNSDGTYSMASSIPASQIKTGANGSSLYNVGGQDISVDKNNDGTYSPSVSSVLGTSTDNLIKSADYCQPGDMVYGTDPQGRACLASVSSSNFDSVSAIGLDGGHHDVSGLVNENGAISSQNMLATGFKGAGNFSYDSNNGTLSFSDQNGNKFTVPSDNVSVGSNGKIAVKPNKDGSFVAKDASGVSKAFEPASMAIRANDGALCRVDKSSIGYKPSGLRYSDLKQNVVVQAQNIKTIDSGHSYDKINNLPKKQDIPIKVNRASKGSNKATNIIGIVSGTDYNKMKKKS